MNIKATCNPLFHVWIPKQPQELRLTPKQALIVQILVAHDGPMTGYEIAKASGGEIAKTGIYVHLDSLQSKGVITSTFEEVSLGVRRVPKRYVQLTSGSIRPQKEVTNERKVKAEATHSEAAFAPG